MERNTKYKPDHLCIVIFTLCLSVRFVEYFLIETDKTAIGENVLHKVGGRCFSRTVHQNTFRDKAIYAGEFYCRIFIWYLAYCNADQKLYPWRNVICGNGSYGYRLYDPFWNYGNQMGASLPYNRKYMGGAWRSFIQ